MTRLFYGRDPVAEGTAQEVLPKQPVTFLKTLSPLLMILIRVLVCFMVGSAPACPGQRHTHPFFDVPARLVYSRAGQSRFHNR